MSNNEVTEAKKGDILRSEADMAKQVMDLLANNAATKHFAAVAIDKTPFEGVSAIVQAAEEIGQDPNDALSLINAWIANAGGVSGILSMAHALDISSTSSFNEDEAHKQIVEKVIGEYSLRTYLEEEGKSPQDVTREDYLNYWSNFTDRVAYEGADFGGINPAGDTNLWPATRLLAAKMSRMNAPYGIKSYDINDPARVEPVLEKTRTPLVFLEVLTGVSSEEMVQSPIFMKGLSIYEPKDDTPAELLSAVTRSISYGLRNSQGMHPALNAK